MPEDADPPRSPEELDAQVTAKDVLNEPVGKNKLAIYRELYEGKVIKEVLSNKILEKTSVLFDEEKFVWVVFERSGKRHNPVSVDLVTLAYNSIIVVKPAEEEQA